MVNKILDSISKALYTKFGDPYRYYVETMEQNTVVPCFHIGVLNPLFRSVNRKDYRWTVPCVLHFFPSDNGTATKTCYSVGQQVLECLEYLEVDDHLLRAEDMSYTIVDDVLQVFLTYRFWTEKPETHELMDDLDINESIV